MKNLKQQYNEMLEKLTEDEQKFVKPIAEKLMEIASTNMLEYPGLDGELNRLRIHNAIDLAIYENANGLNINLFSEFLESLWESWGLDDLEAFHTDIIIVDYYQKACEKIEDLESTIVQLRSRIKVLEEKN